MLVKILVRMMLQARQHPSLLLLLPWPYPAPRFPRSRTKLAKTGKRSESDSSKSRYVANGLYWKGPIRF